ncbi:MAG: MBL fold metallo-hydrolase, partial [Selenomonadaceae bacterium]|nr:MBL fold metallo-hydrolase [Selenomonadaceae bacterium]
MRKIFAAVFGLLFFLFSNICFAYSPEGKLFLTMLDVGQGDSFLIETPTQNILIDTGDVDAREKLVAKLQNLGVTRVEKIILTHPHADHIGGIEKLLKD